jgi:hypothetical protein
MIWAYGAGACTGGCLGRIKNGFQNTFNGVPSILNARCAANLNLSDKKFMSHDTCADPTSNSAKHTTLSALFLTDRPAHWLKKTCGKEGAV